jgi:hypothetical protein
MRFQRSMPKALAASTPISGLQNEHQWAPAASHRSDSVTPFLRNFGRTPLEPAGVR